LDYDSAPDHNITTAPCNECTTIIAYHRRLLTLPGRGIDSSKVTGGNTAVKVIFIPGNGGGSPKDHWFPALKQGLSQLGLEVIDREFPDNILAREAYWMPFLQDELRADESTILVGYSSGAIAAMRYAQTHRLHGTALISAYHTDLGLSEERLSGYFNRPWNWQAIRENQSWILQFASLDDPLIAIDEPRFVHEKLHTEYHEFSDQGHFNFDKHDFPELFLAIKSKLPPPR
jgi:predicted alpha/beta hydrolase family esterase